MEKLRYLKPRNGKIVEWMQGLQLSQCSIIRKFFHPATKLQKKPWTWPAHFCGAGAPKVTDCRIDKTLVNFDVEACAKDIIMKAEMDTTSTVLGRRICAKLRATRLLEEQPRK
jgi:hypothetical protein